ncbi:MAG: hypothetical protein ACI3X1_06740 [Eubacteriales bacterium]
MAKEKRRKEMFRRVRAATALSRAAGDKPLKRLERNFPEDIAVAFSS